jgi:hypothetical protein
VGTIEALVGQIFLEEGFEVGFGDGGHDDGDHSGILDSTAGELVGELFLWRVRREREREREGRGRGRGRGRERKRRKRRRREGIRCCWFRSSRRQRQRWLDPWHPRERFRYFRPK